MAYIVAWTMGTEPADRYEYEDHYVVFEHFAEAVKSYDTLGSVEGVCCVALTKVMDATEPHWIDDVSDGPTDTPKENV